jgi:phenylalanyl-tRNA synthetase alpha chain
MAIINQIQKIRSKFRSDLENLSSENGAVDQIRIKYIGRKGLVASLFVQLGKVDADERPKMGKVLNKLKSEITLEIDGLSTAAGSVLAGTDDLAVDFTLPGDPLNIGSIHPLTQTMEEIKSIFIKLGFSLAYGSEIDTEFYNFEALNIPKHHPARDMQDTFYITDEVLLRTHTSDTQIHFMENNKPPVRIIAPGRVYRNEDVSVRSYCLFHQIEGLYVDKTVTFSELKGTLDYFARELFGLDVKTRFRPSYFPFTEPSAEMDVSCIFCKGNGCGICKKTGWLEILGCGMVDPEVYKSVKYDPDKWTGYAFGLGIERIAMLKYGVQDIRLFYSGDVRFLRQF